MLGVVSRVVPHRPRSLGDLLAGPPVIGHRGFSAAAPENTLASFKKAADLGVMIELDVTLAATGEVVVIHDDELERTTTGTGKVSETPFTDLRTLDAGAWFDACFAGERIPTLREVLDEIDGRVVIDVELKTTPHKRELAEAVVGVLRAADQLERVFVTSFDPFVLHQVRIAEPSLRRGQLVGSYDGTALPWYTKRLLQNLALNRWAVPDLVVVGDDFVTEAWVRAQKDRGYPVLVYTVNEAGRMRELRGWGVDAIITDQPDIGLATLA